MVKIYGRQTPKHPPVLLREMEEVAQSEDTPTNAEEAMAYFAQTHWRVALFSDRKYPDIVYENRRLA